MSFGRKGMDTGAADFGARPAGGFGRQATAAMPNEGGGHDAAAARRAAFLAEERARKSHAAEPSAASQDGPAPIVRTVVVREKSMGIAYLLWFILCGFSAHRFYLGFMGSAMVQATLMPIGYVMLMNKSLAGAAFVLGGALWMLADAFLIPGMVRKANEKARSPNVGQVFA